MPIELKVPAVGESITEVYIGSWHKAEGDRVQQDENVAELESEKATFDLPAPSTGILSRILKQPGDMAEVGEVIAYIEDAQEQEAETGRQKEKKKEPAEDGEAVEDREASRQPAAQPAEEEAAEAEPEPRVMPAAARVLAEHGLRPEDVEATGPGGRLLKEDVLRYVEEAEEREEVEERPPASAPTEPDRPEEAVPMSPIRRRIAHRLVEAQQTAALLTTFNEIDMSAVQALRQEYRQTFQEKYEVKLGFMSFFVKAAIDALKRVPQVNAEIRGNDILFRNYYDIGVAIGGGRGLVVPVLRNAERMSFAEIELAINDFARRARDNELRFDELRGGTFTISNGGVYGSLLSTPIVNPPQSGVLGMHAIQDRPVARDGNIVIRPMMYVALTYDHRLVDGREAVTFLRRIKEVVEEPSRLLLEV